MFRGIGLVRYFSRKRQPDLKKINPKVPYSEADAIAKDLLQVFKERGPLTVGSTWDHAKEVGINGLNSKTHMKILLKWMRGRKMLKLLCTHVGSNKKFFHTPWREKPQTDGPESPSEPIPKTSQPNSPRKRRT
ncbi:hypothetical protein AMTRI_Chr09g17240 [Amborella trichopoda]|uniref:Tumor necrosis factor receptor superfamily member 21 n=1 Tax=Amborella trichopoda TaxID=13333 RepID=W1PKL3_AMBTC|nr:uncharacterized protein LOC18436423 [Amborella trichopoda]ERN08181.1 hypothetical protein AMTR_s00018p00157490 [Amborella trichopoda]|eukprot:XP_006846506.1 uncharacterized protein LOC18436423 [Amborella trichopoda]